MLKPITYAAAAILSLAACVSVTEVPAEIPSLKLVPDNGLPGEYCQQRNSGATRVVDITFLNDGTADYAGVDALTVTFSTGTTRAVARGTIPAIERGRTGTVAVPIPTACFDPDCEFTIGWANQSDVEGFCQG
ncbi:MAG: hypothetical protein AAF222_04150 [Pseudomonadota bacterium]